MSDMNELLELLANRGTQRGADAVLDAAVAEVGADERAGRLERRRCRAARHRRNATCTTLDRPSRSTGRPLVNMDASRPRRRRPWRTALTAGGLAAMLGVVSLGVASLLGGGGANSPESAVRQLADAIENQDPLAAVDVLAPDEVGGAARQRRRHQQPGQGAATRRRCGPTVRGRRLRGRRSANSTPRSSHRATRR